MRPLTVLELIIVCTLALSIVVFLTVGFPRQNAKTPCQIIEQSPRSIQKLKDACKDIREWYEKSE